MASTTTAALSTAPSSSSSSDVNKQSSTSSSSSNLKSPQQHKLTLEEALEIHKQTTKTMQQTTAEGEIGSSLRQIVFSALFVIFVLIVYSWAFSFDEEHENIFYENEIFTVNFEVMKRFSAFFVCLIAALWMTITRRLHDVKVSYFSKEKDETNKNLTPKQLKLIGANPNENVDLYLNAIKSASKQTDVPVSPFKKLPIPFTPNFSDGTPQASGPGAGGGSALSSSQAANKVTSTPSGAISSSGAVVAVTPQSIRGAGGVSSSVGGASGTPSGLLGKKLTSDVYSSPNSFVLVQPSPGTKDQATSSTVTPGGGGFQQQKSSITNTPSSTSKSNGTNSNLKTLVNSNTFGTPSMGGPNLSLASPGPGVGAGTPGLASGTTATSTSVVSVNAGIHCDEDAAYNIVQSLKSKEDKKSGEVLMDEWVGNLKRALRQYIAEEVLKPLDEIHEKLLREKDFPLPNSSTFTLQSLEWEDIRQEPEEMYARYRFAETSPYISILLKQRKLLERFMCVRRHADMVHFPRNYVLKRLRTLVSSGETLSGYNWCGGEAFEGKSWSPERLPTDAEIIFRIVCVWLDNLLQRDESGPSFSSYYVKDEDRVDVDELKNQEWVGFLNCGKFVTPPQQTRPRSKGMVGSPALDFNANYYSGSSSKQFWPHFKFVNRGEIQEVRARRLNVFHCIILFCYWLREQNIARVQEILSKVFAKQSTQ